MFGIVSDLKETCNCPSCLLSFFPRDGIVIDSFPLLYRAFNSSRTVLQNNFLNPIASGIKEITMAMRLSQSSLSRGCRARGAEVMVGTLGVAPSVAFQSSRGYASMSRSGLGLGSRSTYAATQIRYRCNQGYKYRQCAVPALLAPTTVSLPSALSSTTRRGYADLKPSSGKSEADLLVEELQDLYVILCGRM
jgi:hypothetical protein